MLRYLCVAVCVVLVAPSSGAVDKRRENSVTNEEAREREHLRLADLGRPEVVRSVVQSKVKVARRRPIKHADTGGAVYVRWGRNSCGNTDTELVYSGVAAGGLYQDMGGGSDLICLTREPEYANHTDKFEGHARLYGAEYEAPKNYFSHRNAPVNKPNALQDQDVPCAVCRARTRHTALMIPGRKSCPGSGWTQEYWGMLATNHYAHKSQIQHVCVDEAPEGDPKGAPNSNGALLYVVQGVCGSLPCPPYVNNWEITCVVCTK